MFYIACTRFNHITYDENMTYRKLTNIPVIYGTPLKIREIYPDGALLFVVEMNNDTNKIEGIGLIRNTQVLDKRYKIYQNSEYNRYIYKGEYWLKREQLGLEIIETFDTILFKGKSHLKCRTGITIITEKLFTHWDYDFTTLKQNVKRLFLNHYKSCEEQEEQEETGEVLEQEQKQEIFEIVVKKRLHNSNKNIEK